MKTFESLLDYVSDAASRFGDRPAFVIRRRIKKETVTYSQIPEILKKIDLWLTSINIHKGEHILIWSTNSPEYALLLLACLCYHRVAIPIDMRTNRDTLEAILKKTKPVRACISKYFTPTLFDDMHITHTPIEDLLHIIDEPISRSEKKRPTHTKAKMAEIVFTSGTTGIPKGVVITEQNILSNLHALGPHLPDLRGSRTISVLPLSHMLEQIIGLLLPIGQGTAIHYLTRINSLTMLKAFAEYKPTHLVLVPQLLKILWYKIEEKTRSTNKFAKLETALKYANYFPQVVKKIIFKDIQTLFGGHLKFIACGGAPIDMYAGKRWISVGIPVIEGYGATEVTAVATLNSFGAPRIGSAGRAMDGVKITLDENKEIYIQSQSVSDGYYQEPEKTKAAFTPKGYKTGDIGSIDNIGNLFITGRDVFKIVLASGEKVFVEDIERKANAHPLVKECCVVAKQSAGSDTVHAFVILKPDTTEGLEHVIAAINSTLESKQQITSFAPWEDIDFPRTPTLKIDRKTMAAYANSQLPPATTSTQAGPYSIKTIRDILSTVSGVPVARISPEDTLSQDLGIDSLTRVEIASLCEEHLGIILDEANISAKTTVAQLEELAIIAQAVETVMLPTWQFSLFGQFLHRVALKYILIPLHAAVIHMRFPQNTVPTITPGSIIIFNHPGILDGVCAIRVLMSVNQPKMVLNSAYTFWEHSSPFAKPLELFAGGIPLYESGQKLLKVLQTDADLIDAGYNLLFAPQGKLQMSETEDPFKPGIGYIIQQINTPVHIIKIKGYRDIWPVPAKGFENCSLTDFIPPQRGTVEILVSSAIKKDWGSLSPIQISNLLEEKYHAL